MKFAVVGLEDFPLGKKTISDERLNALGEIIKPSEIVSISVELLDASRLQDAGAIICEKESKLDLIINDLEAVESRLLGEKDPRQVELFTSAKAILEKNMCLCEENFSEEEKNILLSSNLASIKPAYFVDKNENKPFQDIILNAYYAAGMICFITSQGKDKELKAWPIEKGATALDAAGMVHSDIKRGFIKAEVIAYDDFIKAGSSIHAKHFAHLEDKGYVIKDADIVNFRFNV